MAGIAGKASGISTQQATTLIEGYASDATPQDVGTTGAAGVSDDYSRTDHVHDHGTIASGDLHPEYQKESEKGAVNGYCGLDASQKVAAGNAPVKAVYITGGAQAIAPEDIGASDRWDNEGAGTVQTTDATPTTCGQVALADAKVSIVTATVAARRDTGAEGAGYVIRGAYRRAGGTVTLIGSVSTPFVAEDVGAWNATLVISGTNVQAQVTGAAGSTIEWRSRFEVKVAP